MAKRLTDSDKWKKQFVKGLSTVHKLFFIYLLDECNHAGIWHVEPEIASIRIGEKIDIEEAKKDLVKHIIEFDNGEKWFIPYFIEFQYGELNPSVTVHNSVIRELTKYGLLKKLKQYKNCSQTDKDKDIDKDIDKDKERFDEARKLYKGTKRGLNTEFTNYKKHKDWKECLGLLKSAIEKQIEHKEKKKSAGLFTPEWQNFKTWLNQRSWELELDEVRIETGKKLFSYNEMLDIMNKQGLKQSNFEITEQFGRDGQKLWRRK